MPDWNTTDSASLYQIPSWGLGFFGVNAAGHVEVHPDGGRDGHPPIDLHELVGQIRGRGVSAPLLLRFDGILRARVRQLYEAFERARAELEYSAPYRLVYPIKVNQEREVVAALLSEGRDRSMGLEVGSKPELLAVITMQAGAERLMICNGYKDDEYVEMALLSRKIGITPILVVEKLTELDTILEASKRLGIEPIVGVRTKLNTAGSGRWQASGGDRSKFGLTTREIVLVVERLREEGMLHCLQLLHFHIGSQMTNIRSLKNALREASRTFVGLHEMGASVRWLDVGGGLGIDYDGSSTNFESSMNYSLQEYASDVVWHIGEACKEAGIEQPTILSESGRALTAHHAVLVTEVLGVTDHQSVGVPSPPEEDEPEIVRAMAEVCEDITAKSYQEAYNDARELRERAMMQFELGQIDMPRRARVEEFYWRSLEKILRITRRLEYVPEDLDQLERELADTYFLNFSIFQSVPDSWAIKQLFPVMPIHRLDEEPTRRAVLADITCDSDGKIDRFIDLRDVKSTLELHPVRKDEPYYIGLFLVGAYQEILGDMHNLFGDTNIVHVDLDERGSARIKHIARGDRVKDVLGYVRYFETELLRDLRDHIEESLEQGLLTLEESAAIVRRFEAGLRGYTYLSRERRPLAAPAIAETFQS